MLESFELKILKLMKILIGVLKYAIIILIL
jgi:hypothetical protein